MPVSAPCVMASARIRPEPQKARLSQMLNSAVASAETIDAFLWPWYNFPILGFHIRAAARKISIGKVNFTWKTK